MNAGVLAVVRWSTSFKRCPAIGSERLRRRASSCCGVHHTTVLPNEYKAAKLGAFLRGDHHGKARSAPRPLRSAAGGHDEDAAASRAYDRSDAPAPCGVLRPGSSAVQRELRMTWMSRSRIFLRRVLRLKPSSSAALIWLPRVAASAAPISGSSTRAGCGGRARRRQVALELAEIVGRCRSTAAAERRPSSGAACPRELAARAPSAASSSASISGSVIVSCG